MSEKRRILLTGAGGFIGSALYAALNSDDDFSVFGTISPRVGAGSQLSSLDISDASAAARTFAKVKPDIVVNAAGRAHFRGESIADLLSANVSGVKVLADAAESHGVKHFVHLSSTLVYGESHEGTIVEDSPTNTSTPYGDSKLKGEVSAVQALSGSDTSLTILRLSMVPSTGNYSNLHDLALTLRSGRFIWIGDGSNLKTMTALDDLIRAITAVLKSDVPKGARTYNIAGGHVSMKDVVSSLSEGLGVPAPTLRMPSDVAFLLSRLLGGRFGVPSRERVEKFISSDKVSGEKFQREFRVSFDTNLREVLREYGASLVN
jgi:nucleoside-diphosphate-sugar epimerase